MKLTCEQMLSFIEPSTVQINVALDRMSPFMAYACTAAEMKRCVLEGQINANIIAVKGVDSFVIFWTKTPVNGLCILGAACLLDGEDRWDLLMTAFDLLAKNLECSHVIFHTARPGAAKKSILYGYVAETVCFVRKL